MEYTLGEGPARDAVAELIPVAASGTVLRSRWPGYGPAIESLGIGRVVAVPLQVPGDCIGALAVFDARSATTDITRFMRVADALTRSFILGREAGDGLSDEIDHRPEVHQAAGMVSVQTGCHVTDALELVSARVLRRPGRRRGGPGDRRRTTQTRLRGRYRDAAGAGTCRGLRPVDGEAARDPLDTQALLAALVESGRRLFGARGAIVQYTPGGAAAIQTDGTDGALQALAADAVGWQEGPVTRSYDGLRPHRRGRDHPPHAGVLAALVPARPGPLGHGRVTALPLFSKDGPAGRLVLFTAPGSLLDERALKLSRSLAPRPRDTPRPRRSGRREPRCWRDSWSTPCPAGSSSSRRRASSRPVRLTRSGLRPVTPPLRDPANERSPTLWREGRRGPHRTRD
ncbi:hypothetical protein [Streptomyces sp. KL116D]|uniref:hypothetical protein n=1 Tax=Streptomyces sp. KL116D TaxID=3045152 RepID=UPI0035579498